MCKSSLIRNGKLSVLVWQKETAYLTLVTPPNIYICGNLYLLISITHGLLKINAGFSYK